MDQIIIRTHTHTSAQLLSHSLRLTQERLLRFRLAKKRCRFNEYTNHLDQPLPSFQVFVSRLCAGKHSIPALLKLSGHTAFMQRTPETRVNRLRFPRFKPPQGDPLAAVRTFHIPGCVPGFDVICSLYVVRVITALRRFSAKRYRHVSFSLSTCAMCVHHVRKKKSFVNTSFCR